MNKLNEDRKYCVYAHTSPNHKAYIGITKQNVEDRWGVGGSHYKKNEHFWNAINIYGWENFEHSILFEELTKEEACKIEILLIALFETQNPEYGYNVSPGGNLGFAGCKLSDEAKQKISNSKIGKSRKPFDDTTKEKMRLSKLGTKNPMYGKHPIVLNETKNKLRQSKIGDLNPMFGRYGKDNKTSIPICQCDNNLEVVNFFWSSYDAERKTGINHRNINSVCIGKPDKNGYIRRTAGGYCWRYATEEEVKNAKNTSI